MAVSTFSICQRVAVAVFGGYTLAVAVSTSLSHALPMARADAVLSSLLVGFLVYAAVIVWAFGARSISRMWTGVILLIAGFGSLAILLKLARGS